ncbi:hypothetical protein LXL04_006960 [Taraxacum kok-saghyz]
MAITTTATDYTAATPPRRSSYFSVCMSPSCVPVDEQYTRIKSPRTAGNHHHHHHHHHQRRKLKKLMNKVVEESKKSIYGSSKPLVFRYDAYVTPIRFSSSPVQKNFVFRYI